MDKMRVALYLRLSKEDMQGECISESIKNQELLLKDYAQCNEWEVVKVYTDEDYSGLYDDRPAFSQMISDAYAGLFEIVLAKNQSRFTRNMVHMEKYLHEIFPKLGIRFIGILDGVDTDKKTNKKARQIYALTNEWYCEDLSENIRMVFRKKMKAGQNLAAYAPYGYQKDITDHHMLVIDEEAADVVRFIFRSAAEGKKAIEIAHKLDTCNVKTPTEYRKHLAHEKAWSVSTIQKILTNPTYIGTLVQGKSERISYKDKRLRYFPAEDWICIKGHHEPIVDVDEYEMVQAIRKKRKK